MFGLDLAQHREAILQQVNFSSTYISMPFSLTVEENLKVIARLYSLQNIQQRIDDIIEKLEMGDIQHKLTRKLSSGQMSRLTLAKALMTEPKVLFLDEPRDPSSRLAPPPADARSAEGCHRSACPGDAR